MPDFGKNNQAVQWVLDFIESGKLLFAGELPKGIDAVIIHDLKKIPTDEDYEQYGEDTYVWRDIIEEEISEFFCIKISLDIHRFLSDLVIELERKYKKTFLRKYKKACLDKEIPGLLGYIIQCRVVMGKKHKFFETLFEILKSGGYPCGWEGHYPEGKLIVYYPKK